MLITYSTATPPAYAAPLVTLGVKLNTAGGTVTSSPAGIECGATCSYQFTRGTKIKLTAAASAGKVFTGWGGACSGRKRVCEVRATRYKLVTASFK